MRSGVTDNERQRGSGKSYALLTDGSMVEIRRAEPGDIDTVRAMHEDMSPENLYLRFFSFSPRSVEPEARRVCRGPDSDHAALLAWLGQRLVGVASYEVTQKPGVAEVAFAVSDKMHGHGIATLLLEHLISLGREQGLHAFTADMLAENSSMSRVLADAGLAVQRRMSDGVMEMTFPLPAESGDSVSESYLDSVAARESRADVASLRHLLTPTSIAVVGASRQRGTVGREILHNIVTGGFSGAVYPVNPRAAALEGLPCLASPADLPDHVDVAVIAVPAASVVEVAAECGRRRVRSLVVVTSGLGRRGADLLATCHRYGMRLVGPNCFGFAVPDLGLDATFAVSHPAPGIAGLVVQSGGLGISLLGHLSQLGIGISSFASVGDKYDISSNDLLMWWEQDPKTRLAVLYVESFGSPRKFARTARRVGQQMPVLTVVGGRSAAGQRAAASHTAAAATPVVTQEALFAQAGIIAVHGLGELVETAALLARQPLPAGDRIAVVSNAGGAGVLAADACVDNGLRVAALSAATQERLAQILPAGASLAGPVDTTAAVSVDAFRTCLREVAADDGVDAILVVNAPTAIADLRRAVGTARFTMPLAAVLLDQPEAVRMLPDGRHEQHTADVWAVPCYAYPEGAARALGHAARYHAWRERQRGSIPSFSGLRTQDPKAILADFLANSPDGGWLPPSAVSDLLACYQIPLVPTRFADSEDEAVRVAASTGGPVVMKADAEGVVHKTEAGAVKLDLHGEQEVREGYRHLTAAFGASLRKVLVQPMLAGGVEVLVGVVQEPVFGPLVVFGLGGVATEVLGDHAARLTPLTDVDADDLVCGIHAAPLLFGHRGTPPVDITALTDVLLRVSHLADDLHDVAELDLNPVIASPAGVQAVDARIRVRPVQPRDPFLRQLR